MPTYEYRCQSCGATVEVVQSFTDEPLVECEACGGPLRKVFAPVGIVFKGSGFYKTDSRSSRSTTAAATSPTSDAGTASSDGGAAKDGATDAKSGGAKDGAKPADGGSATATPAPKKPAATGGTGSSAP